MVHIEKNQEENSESGSGVFNIARKVLMAGIGATIIAEEEITSFVNRMFERGEIAEIEANQLIQEAMAHREKIAQQKAESRSKRKSPLSVASKSEIITLNARLDELSDRIDEL